MSDIWKLDIHRNPDGARYVWCVDIYHGSFHFREVEHNSRELAVRLANSIVQEQLEDTLEQNDYPTLDQFGGLILGKAVGDAVGAPVERASVEETRRYIDERIYPRNFDGVLRSAFEELPFGHYTDDTQMARELMRSLIDSGGTFDPENYAVRIARLFDDGIIVGSGGTTRRAVSRLIDGVPWDEAGEGSSAGNGSAMRVAPLGALPQLLGVARAAESQSKITHTHPISVASSVFVACMVHQALYYPHEITPLQMLEKSEDYLLIRLEENEELRIMYAALSQLRGHIESCTEPEEVLRDLLTFQDEEKSTWEGISPYALTSSLWAAYSFVTCPDDFWKCIETSLWPGGDVDTIAAMAGAMWGARNGVEGLPDVVLDQLNDDGEWEAPDLIDLADQLYLHIREQA